MIKVDDLSVVYGENNQIVATLVDKNNNYLKNYELIFNCNGEDDKVITNNEGKASLPIYDGPGVYKVTIHFLGDEKYGDSHKTITLTINSPQNNNQPTIQKKNIIIKLNSKELKDKVTEINKNAFNGEFFKFIFESDGKPLKKLKKVTFKIGSKEYKNKKLNNNGVYKTKITAKPTKIIVEFKGNGEYNKIKKGVYVYQNIKTITGPKSVKYNGKITLNLGKLKKKLKVFIKGYKDPIIFNTNGEGTFKVNKYNLGVGIHKLKFYSKDKIYRVDATHKLTITK